jgi:hypothetical protein
MLGAHEAPSARGRTPAVESRGCRVKVARRSWAEIASRAGELRRRACAGSTAFLPGARFRQLHAVERNDRHDHEAEDAQLEGPVRQEGLLGL